MISMTSHDANLDSIQGFRMGADDYLPKPLDLQELGNRIYRCLDRRAEVQELLKAGPKQKATTTTSMKGSSTRLGWRRC